MATEVTNYQCPACTGPLHYNGGSGRLECDFCGSSYTPEEIEKLYREKEQQSAQVQAEAEAAADESPAAETDWSTGGTPWNAEADGLKALHCPACGAELLCGSSTAALSCPYCGNPGVVPGQFSGALRPDWILPFRLDKEAALAALNKHYGKRFLLPRAFTSRQHMEEIKGLYVPFWLFSCTAECDCEYEGTRTHMHREGDYEVTETSHFMIRRSGSVSFDRVPVDGSRKMPDDYMDSIEPFDYGELKPFSTAYLPGFLADRYDLAAEDVAGRADERCRSSAAEAMRADVTGYEAVIPRRERVRLMRGRVQYALMPVWLLTTSWNGKNYLFAMNGQTGKLVGDLPVSFGRRVLLFGIITGASTLIGALLWLLSSGIL